MEKVVCSCGCTKWRYEHGLVLTSYPPIHVSIYKCENCGEEYKQNYQPSIEELHPVHELFEPDKQ